MLYTIDAKPNAHQEMNSTFNIQFKSDILKKKTVCLHLSHSVKFPLSVFIVLTSSASKFKQILILIGLGTLMSQYEANFHFCPSALKGPMVLK